MGDGGGDVNTQICTPVLLLFSGIDADVFRAAKRGCYKGLQTGVTAQRVCAINKYSQVGSLMFLVMSQKNKLSVFEVSGEVSCGQKPFSFSCLALFCGL